MRLNLTRESWLSKLLSPAMLARVEKGNVQNVFNYTFDGLYTNLDDLLVVLMPFWCIMAIISLSHETHSRRLSRLNSYGRGKGKRRQE